MKKAVIVGLLACATLWHCTGCNTLDAAAGDLHAAVSQLVDFLGGLWR